MKFIKTNIQGAYLIEPTKHEDHRGFFARLFCKEEFSEQGLVTNFVQANISRSERKHTLRGLHYQTGDSAEAKLIRCTRGRIMDVIVDIREESPTYLKHYSVELVDHEHKQLYVPEGCAHGFLTLSESCEVSYLVSAFYSPSREKGLRWNDPIIDIKWPVELPILSEKDSTYPNYVS